MSKLQHLARWTDDCQGKKDFDGPCVVISSRYWPGHWTIFDSNHPEKGLHDVAVGGPSATSSLEIRHGDPEDQRRVTLASQDFNGPSEADVKAQVEAWAEEQFQRMVKILCQEFGVEAPV